MNVGLIKLEGVHGLPVKKTSARYLIERSWPRGSHRHDLNLAGWPRELAPSGGLWEWFHHHPEKFNEFRRRYFMELDRKPELWMPLIRKCQKGNIALLYHAKHPRLNPVAVLRDFLGLKLKKIKAGRETGVFASAHKKLEHTSWRGITPPEGMQESRKRSLMEAKVRAHNKRQSP